MKSGDQFIALRNRLLLSGKRDLAGDKDAFKWNPEPSFNWANDYFDRIAVGNEAPALRVVDDAGTDRVLSYAQLAHRSNQMANFLIHLGVKAGDRVLIMLGNVVPLWETMLATIKIGAVMIPTTTLLQRDEVQDRIRRGGVTAIITERHLSDRFENIGQAPIRIVLGGALCGWQSYEQSHTADATLVPVRHGASGELLLLYFTSGTTSKPKLVAHTHTSYPVGHLSTAYWIGLRAGDVHLNLSSPGWAKHAWSCFFAPFNAEATVLAYQYERFSPTALLDQLVRCGVTTFCAPPTVWRLLVQQDLRRWPVSLRELVGAGEPLNPEVIARVQEAWGLTIRDGYGQTETTAQVGNPPGAPLKPGSMGRPLPGYTVALIDADGARSDEGEICLPLSPPPLGLMSGYLDDPERTSEVMRDGYYHTGDIARCDEEGYLTYVGRTDDVFKSSDYRISPFELESVILEHPDVVEAAVVPSPDPIRLAVPKAYVTLTAAAVANGMTARSILEFVRGRVSPFKRIRRLELAVLPKTLSGKIRRTELRMLEESREPGSRHEHEYWEEDFVSSSEYPMVEAHAPLCWICRRNPAGDGASTFAQSICRPCNNAATQPFDEAWRQLSGYLHARWRDIVARGRFDLSAVFPGEAEPAAVRVHLYFVKLLGCKLLAEGTAVNLESFAAALLDCRPHPEVTLLVANSLAPAGKIISYNSDVSVLRQGDEVYSALWTYWAHPIAVKVCYLKAGTPVREPEGFPWHPARQRKIVKLSPYKGDTRPMVARRDLRI